MLMFVRLTLFFLESLSRKCAAAGMVAGCLAQFLASPNDLVKVRMQMEGRRLLEGKEPRYVCCTLNEQFFILKYGAAPL